MQHKDIYLLEDVIENCAQIENFIDRFGDSFEKFSNDIAYQNSCAFCLFQIGESVNALSDFFRNSHKEIEWRQIVGLRNLLAHEYGHIDIASFWKTLKEDVPRLRSACEKIIK